VAIETPPAPDQAADDRAAANSLTVLYDGGCGVCSETVRHLRRWDRACRMEFLPYTLAATSGRPILERLAAEGHLADAIHVVNESTGEVVSGGHAALALLDVLPGGWLLRPWTAMPQTALAADMVYRVASRHRDRLAWLMGMRNEVSCPIGTPAGSADTDR
jgi:predicted DCC family thiol-disulfide oxidoreductase YuxK